MPWHRKSTKGAASCDKPRGGANGLRSGGARMGKPAWGHAQAPPPECIGRREATGGTETSKYPEEEKSNEIARVAASESAPSPNPSMRYSPKALLLGGRGHRTARGFGARGAVKKWLLSGTAWEGRRYRVKAPYAKSRPPARCGSRVAPDTRNPARSRGDRPPRLNTLR